MDNPDLGQLKRLAIFATVVEQGSFAQAAKHLNMSRSSVSEQVAILESQLGVRLLQRTTRQLTLTREGEAIYPEAALLPRALNRVAEAINQEQPKGRVRITANLDMAIHWLSPRLQAFREHYPDIWFDLILADSELDLIANQIDLALRVGFLEDDSLVARPLFEDSPQIVASSRYLERCGTPKTIEELQQHQWILFTQLNTNNQITLQSAGEIIEFTPENYHLCDSPVMMRHMIESGMGIGLHLTRLLDTALADGSVQLILPDWRSAAMTISLVYPSRRQMPLRTRCLVDFLLK